MTVIREKSTVQTEAVSLLSDINECTNKTVCGDHAFCQNLIGTYLCVCDMGFTTTADGKACIGRCLPSSSSSCGDTKMEVTGLLLSHNSHLPQSYRAEDTGAVLCVAQNQAARFSAPTSHSCLTVNRTVRENATQLSVALCHTLCPFILYFYELINQFYYNYSF